MFAVLLLLVPPGNFRTSPWVALAVLSLTAAAALIRRRRVRNALARWLSMSLTVTWLVGAATFVMMTPTASTPTITLPIMLAGLVWLVTIVVVSLRRMRRRPADAIGSVAVVAVGLVLVVNGADVLNDTGLRWRFERERPRYEQAVRDGTVEEHGGFVDGPHRGWVWANQLVLDPLSGVVFDSEDRLDNTSAFMLGESASCRRLRPAWLYCEFD